MGKQTIKLSTTAGDHHAVKSMPPQEGVRGGGGAECGVVPIRVSDGKGRRVQPDAGRDDPQGM